MIASVLRALAEVQHRRLYAERGYPSMFALLTKELKYSESAAMRRIEALRLSLTLPEVPKLIEEGELSLSVALEQARRSRSRKPCVNWICLRRSGTRESVRWASGL